MNWDSLGEAVDSLRNSLVGQMMATKRGADVLDPAQTTMVKAYLEEFLKQKGRDQDVALTAAFNGFPNNMTVGGAAALLNQMLQYWSEYRPGILETSPDDLDV